MVSGGRDMMHLAWISAIAYPAFLGFTFPSSGGKRDARAQDQTAILLSRICLSLVAAALLTYAALAISAHGTPSSDAIFRQNLLVRYVLAHTRPQDTIAVLPLGGEPYMFGRPAALGYTYLAPGGRYNSASQILQAGNEIVRHRPRLVAFGRLPKLNGRGALTDWSSFFAGSTRIMRFARSYRFSGYLHLHGTDDGGVYRIYTRK